MHEVIVKIQGEQHYLWRTVDKDSEEIGVFLQARRDGNPAKRFFLGKCGDLVRL